MTELEKWFKIKKYPHIGIPITIKDYNRVKKYVEDVDKIRTHSFLPFIHKSITKRKFRADNSLERTPSGKRKRVRALPKKREIFFSSHLDSLIFSKYNETLSVAYEKHLENKAFNECIVAYRKISIPEDLDKNKCNIEFAKSAFEFIHKNRTKKLTAIVADVTSFFDNLNHKILKRQWVTVIDETTLPQDHYNIFKALTKIKYVEGKQLFEAWNNEMIVECGVPNSSTKKVYKRKKINHSNYFKEKNVVSYCSKKEFIRNNLNLIISKENTKGIPQGSPISATLANIYMLDFDRDIFNDVSAIEGFYQRYSDDLIVICEQKYENDIINLIRTKISTLTDLQIQPDKTKVFRFEDVNGSYKGYLINEVSKEPNYNKTLEYLGFSYNGQKVLIKTSGFSKFYRSMKSTFKRSASLALYSKNPDKRIFKSTLYKRFTFKGAKRKLIYKPSKENSLIYQKTKEFYWGNYLSYVFKANSSFKRLNGDNSIRKQSRKIWRKFHVLMKTHTRRLKY